LNSMIRLGPSGIEYLTHTWNFYSGCRHKQQGKCPPFPCWAERLVKRHSNHYPNGFEPTFYPEAFLSPLNLRKPARIGVCFMGDLFGDWVDLDMKIETMLPSGVASIGMTLKGWIFTTIRQCPQHRFLFLTKNPAELAKWDPFPDNCWVGVSATNQEAFIDALSELSKVEAKVKYISFEPLLESMNGGECEGKRLEGLAGAGINWVIIGAQTKPTKKPEWQWVKDIIEAADKAGIPVFLKNNLGLPKWSCEGAAPFYREHSSGTMELVQNVAECSEGRCVYNA